MKTFITTAVAMLLLCAATADAQVKTYRIPTYKLKYEVYRVKVDETSGTIVLDITTTNEGTEDMVVCEPDLVWYPTASTFRLIRCSNKKSILLRTLKPGVPQTCRFVYDTTKADKIRLYGGGFREHATFRDVAP